MPDRCVRCDETLDEARIITLLGMNRQRDEWDCLKCAGLNKTKPVGFWVMGGEKGARKVGGELIVLDHRNPNFKENLRQATRVVRRGR